MHWARRVFGSFLATLLLLSLLAGTGLTSSYLALHSPTKLESWIVSSKLADSFEQSITTQAEQDINGNVAGASLNNSVIAQAVQNAFPASTIQQDITTVITSNYDWLNGRTPTPDFSIDFTSAKQSFASQIGAYVQTRLASLPICSATQLAQTQSFNPLTTACRPQNLSAATVGDEVSQQLISTTSFLSTITFTADNINPHSSTPYYRTLAQLPRLYRLSTAAVIGLGVVSLVLAGALIVALPGWRRGVRRVASTLVVADFLIAAGILLDSAVVTQVQKHVFKGSSVGSIQTALVHIVRQGTTYTGRTMLYIGIGFLALAVVLYVILLATRRTKQPKAVTVPAPEEPTATVEPPQPPTPPQQFTQRATPVTVEHSSPQQVVPALTRQPAAVTPKAAPQPSQRSKPAMDIIGAKPKVWVKPEQTRQDKPASQTSGQPMKRQVQPRRPRLIQ